MPMVSDMIQSKYLKKDDFPKPQVLTIRDCSLEEVGDGESRWVLWLKENAKGLVLNVTKIRELEAGYGKNTDDWVGRKVRLSHDPSVSYAGKRVGGIKLETSAKDAPANDPLPNHEDFDDTVPF